MFWGVPGGFSVVVPDVLSYCRFQDTCHLLSPGLTLDGWSAAVLTLFLPTIFAVGDTGTPPGLIFP